MEVALAKRAEVHRFPTPPEPVQPPPGAAATVAANVNVPAVEPDLPAIDKTELVADAFSRGQFCMKTGNEADAILAFREAVKVDPTFSEAWQNLAVLYEKAGESAKALEAFRNAKRVASH